VWGAQSEASPAFALSIERGAAVETLPPANTLADGLEGGIRKSAFARASAVVAGVVVVSEDDIASAIATARYLLGLTIEGSAAAALAPLLTTPPIALRDDVVIVLSGRNIDP
jgi:threonine dehydratase